MMKIEEKDYRLPFSIRIGLIGGGYLVGALVGYAFKGGWREIYSDADQANSISMKWSIQNHLSDAISLNLKFQF